ncbi:hypothetical protein J2X97_002953 [Epilithonimonas hungarica]|nr:hypothetical protein [Epilithonimonas hungarica]
MKISELKKQRIIHRPTHYFDSDGNRIYEEFEYISKLNLNYKNSESERLCAKLIDLSLFFPIICFLTGTVIFSFFMSLLWVII